MLDYVVDANILISMLISGSPYHQTVVKLCNFCTPAFALVEVKKYQDIIFRKSRLNNIEIRRFGYHLFSEIVVCPDLIITPTAHKKAKVLVENIDVKDTDYVALAIQIDQILLTRDKPLYQGLRKKGFRRVLMFDEFVSSL